MSTPKRHHINPQFHLENFVGDQPRGHVWTYDKELGTCRSNTPANTAVQTHYYSFERTDGTLDTSVEEFLATVEGVAAPIYARLLKGILPNDRDKGDFAHFLAVQYLRTPTMRRLAAQMYGTGLQVMSFATAANEDAFEASIARYQSDTGKHLTDQEKAELRRNMIDPSGFVVEIPKHITLRNLALAEKLADLLFKMNWVLARPIAGYFISSDNPVVRQVHKDSVHPFHGDGGFLNKTAEVSYPLSPKLMLIMMWSDVVPMHVECPRSFVERLNAGRVGDAEKEFYAHVKDKRLMRHAGRVKNVRPQIRISGLGPKKFAKTVVPRRWRDKKVTMP